MLEADRLKLYAEMPVKSGWHNQYVKGLVNTEEYWYKGNKLYLKESRISLDK